MIITVDVREIRHTCPANDEPHWIDRQNTVVAVQDDGPCRTPVLVRVGDHQAHVACGSIRPREKQCTACRTLLIVRHVTYTDLEPQAPQQSQVTT